MYDSLLIIIQAAEFLDVPDLYQLLANEIEKQHFEEDGIIGDVGNVKTTAHEESRPVRILIIVIIILKS